KFPIGETAEIRYNARRGSSKNLRQMPGTRPFFHIQLSVSREKPSLYALKLYVTKVVAMVRRALKGEARNINRRFLYASNDENCNSKFPAMPRKLPRSFYSRSALEVASDLLGKVLVRNLDGRRLTGKIVETEAYVGPHDLACHASKGHTPRTAIMFGPPGYAY